MWFLEKKFTLPIGHRLSKHKGLCKNMHGHNFTIIVTFKGSKLDKNDMLMDFSVCKEFCYNFLLNDFDHCYLCNSKDVKTVDEEMKVISFDSKDPTAEVIAEFLYKKLETLLKKKMKKNNNKLQVHSVKVFENENNAIIFTGD